MPAESSKNELVLCSQRVVTPTGVVAANVRLRGEQIIAIEDYDPEAGEDLRQLALLPGLVDPHVHFNEPGRTQWEGFATGSAAAAAGGTTLVVDMPLNSSPVTTTVAALVAKREAAKGKLSIDAGFHGGLVPGNEDEIAGLVDAGVLGIKAFLCDSGLDEFPAATERELRLAMPLLAERNVPLLVHAELARPMAAMPNPRCYADYLATRPPEFERDATLMMIDLCRATGCPTHIVHLADAGSLPMLEAARAEGLPLTVETCPHYLFFTSEQIADGACEYKCAPPIRDAANREALWQGLRDGVIDLIASDHSPCPPADKHLDTGRFDLAWGGISSVQLTLPVVWTESQRRGFDLVNVANFLANGPAKLIGQRSAIEVGAKANLVVFDPEAKFTVTEHGMLHRHKLTPYLGCELKGVVRRTYLRGQLVQPGRGMVL